MKPPPRKRTKRDRNASPEPNRSSCHVKLVCNWQRGEQRKLLSGLKTLKKTTGGEGDIDYEVLKTHVPTRSISEIHSVIESLKDKAISGAHLKLKTDRRDQKRVQKPIEIWADLASVVSGSFEEPISAAFSQMLMVSSTEPRTVRNCDPPKDLRPTTKKGRPAGRTVPFRPMPQLSHQGEHPVPDTAHPVLVCSPQTQVVSPAERVPALFKVVRVRNKNNPPPQQQTPPTAASSTSQSEDTSCQPGGAKACEEPPPSLQTTSQTVSPVTGQVRTAGTSAAAEESPQQHSETHLTVPSNTSSTSTSSSPHTPVSLSAAGSSPVLSSTPSSRAASCSSPTLSTPAAALHARFGRTSKYATKDSPRTLGVKCVVDFERIYRYLSMIHNPDEECQLTAMESAILLDLLMSLPDELSLLDCNQLHKHLKQVYERLSSPAGTKTTEETLKELRDAVSAQGGAPSGGDANRDDTGQNRAEAADSSDVTDGGGKTPQQDGAENQSSGQNETSGQSGDKDMTQVCPPLNPFMVPLNLLRRRQVEGQNS